MRRISSTVVAWPGHLLVPAILLSFLCACFSGCFHVPDVGKITCNKNEGCPWGYACAKSGTCCTSANGTTCDNDDSSAEEVGAATSVDTQAGGTSDVTQLDSTAIDTSKTTSEAGTPIDTPWNQGDASPDSANGDGGATGLDAGGEVAADVPLPPLQDSGTGGVPGTGGSTGTGGVMGNGGSRTDASVDSPVATGGVVGTGGTTGTGGVLATGGTTSTGGVVGTGGVTGSGGIAGTGGTASTGGITGTGGTPGTGGTTSPLGASGYPPAGASGQAQPTGAGTTVTVLAWAGFKAAISFTFDDTNSSQISNYAALQALNDKGNNVHYTFFMVTSKTTEMGSSVWPQAVRDGHELGNHTKSHNATANAADIQAAEDTIQSMFGVTAYSFAAPNGDTSYQTVVPTMNEFLTNRTVSNGGISMTENPSSRQYALPCIIPNASANAATMEGLLGTGVTGGKWQIFLVHGFTGGSDGAYQPVDIAQFTATVQWAKDQGNIWIDSVGNVSAYWIAGYKFSTLIPTTSGTDKTWTWQTSNFSTPFPPSRYLRVTTDGGTLRQGSTVLSWDSHGYYEVSLDAGTLTLSQ